MSETQHTPLPWHRGKRGSSKARETMTVQGSLSLVYAGANFQERVIAYLYRESDAEYVRRACNCHEELLKACKLGLEWMGMESVPGASVEQEEAAIRAVEAAIAKAEDKP